MYEKVKKDMERINELIAKVKEYIDFAKEVGIDTSKYEEELADLESKRARIEEALKSRGL